jgi:flagellin
MALRIMTNDAAINAQRNLEMTSQRLQSTQEKLSSGYRINHASDDAAGLAISDTLNATIRSIGQAIRNAQDGASLIQVFEGGTNEINNTLMRIRELAIQAATDTVGERERIMLDNEVQELKQEVDRIAKTTKYAGHTLLDGSSDVLEFQVGPNNDPEKDRIIFDPGQADLTGSSLGIDGLDLRTKENAQDILDTLDDGIQRVNEIRARVGSVQSRLMTTVSSQMIFSENLTAAKSRMRDADIAAESTNYSKESIIRQSGIAMLLQANQSPGVALQLLRGFGG